MNSSSSKQLERAEKKKKKLVALANIVQLNDKYRLENAKEQRAVQSDDADDKQTLANAEERNNDDGFIKVKKVKESRKRNETQSVNSKVEKATRVNLESNQDEPRVKRKKVESEKANEGSTSAEFDIPRSLTEEEYSELRSKLRERKRQIDDVPHLQLREPGYRALLNTPQEQRTPVFLTDIQHLIMTALIGKKSPCPPDRWCLLQKSPKLSHSVVLIVDGMSLYHYLSHESKFVETNKIFETRLEVVLPPRKEGLIMSEMAQVPLTNMQTQELIEKYGSLETAIEMNKDPTLFVKTIFPIKSKSDVKIEKPKPEKPLPPTDKFPRTKLLLSALQMVDEGYPMPLSGELFNRYHSYIYTREQYAPVTDHSPMFGVDCEMCKTSIGVKELTRISIVNEKMETVYESLVRPENKIVNYLTQFSGITPELLATVTKTLKMVQREVSELLPPDAILVGQSLQFDLHALRMMHPYVIDTSVIFNLTGSRRMKSKLQLLALSLLKESIQKNSDGHDSVEDSAAALKLVQKKLANNIEFGDLILTQHRRLQEVLSEAEKCAMKNNIIAHASKRDKRTAIITIGELETTVKEIIKKAEEANADTLKSVNIFELESNKKAVKKAKEVALEHALTIAKLEIAEEHTVLDAMDTTIEKLDKWINKLWKTIAHNGLFLVLMAGANDCPNGVAKIAIKRNIADVAAEVPVTL